MMEEVKETVNEEILEPVEGQAENQPSAPESSEESTPVNSEVSEKTTEEKTDEEFDDEFATDLDDGYVDDDDEEDDDEEDDDAEGEDSDEDLMKEAEQLLAHLFEKRRIHGANKNTVKKLGKSKKNVVVPDGRMYEAEEKKIQAEYEQLRAAARSIPQKKVLNGKLIGASEEPNLHCAVGIVQLKGSEGHFRIIIPSNRLFLYDEKDYAGPEGIEELKNKIKNRIGAEIRFVIYDVDLKTKTAVASRIDAMEIDGRRNYILKQRQTDRPKIVPGTYVYGTITELKMNGFFVEVAGAECYIKGPEIAHHRTRPVNELFNVGEQVTVKVKSVNTKDVSFKIIRDGKLAEKVYHMVEIEASRSEAMSNPNEVFYDKVNIGDVFEAEITAVDEKGVFVLLPNKVEVICFIPQFGDVPRRGQGCVVNIIDKEDETHRFSGIISRLNND